MGRVKCKCGKYCDPKEMNIKDVKDRLVYYKYIVCPNCKSKLIIDLKFDEYVSFDELYEIYELDK